MRLEGSDPPPLRWLDGFTPHAASQRKRKTRLVSDLLRVEREPSMAAMQEAPGFHPGFDVFVPRKRRSGMPSIEAPPDGLSLLAEVAATPPRKVSFSEGVETVAMAHDRLQLDRAAFSNLLLTEQQLSLPMKAMQAAAEALPEGPLEQRLTQFSQRYQQNLAHRGLFKALIHKGLKGHTERLSPSVFAVGLVKEQENLLRLISQFTEIVLQNPELSTRLAPSLLDLGQALQQQFKALEALVRVAPR